MISDLKDYTELPVNGNAAVEKAEEILNVTKPENGSVQQDNTKGKKERKFRKPNPFKPIILIMAFIFLLIGVLPALEYEFRLEGGAAYTDNAFQLSDYDLQRNDEGHPDLNFVKHADDIITELGITGTYYTRWRWWRIEPTFSINGKQYIINPEKQRMDFQTGVKIARQLGELELLYGYYPEIYYRDYTDDDGTGELEPFSYSKNLYRADLSLNPFKKSTVSLDFKWEDYFYNKYFTEFDGNITTWTLGWHQSFPTFYLDAAYGYKVYDTDSNKTIDIPEDASYESNVYTFGVLIKKMPLDSRYPNIEWRPELDLKFEERFYQGSDSWHAGRTDNFNTTTGTLHFYFGDDWNINLDYSHIFRNVDAVNSSVRKYKEFSENEFGIKAYYRF